ncbi:MAG: sulfur carrier protein ThiS [Anaerolineaceae bacterium]|nr:sulfur carrier protein ThiS [Anaerolineaceae bacterium]
MEISVNGKPQTVDEGITVSQLLAALEVTVGRVAVELNRQIVPKAEHDSVTLSAGDKVEIVSFVGGG